MNRRIMSALFAGLILCVFLILPMYNARGFGDFDSDYDFGGYDSDYDFGGYDSSDYSSGSGGSSRSSSSSGIGLTIAWIFILILWIPIVVVTIIAIREDKASGGQTSKKIRRIDMDQGAYDTLRERDPGFSESSLIEYIKTLFTEMQTGWEAGDISNVQYGFVPDTWQRFATQLEMKNRRGETTHVRDISFREVCVVGFTTVPRENRDKMHVRIQVEYNVWVTNKGGKYIQGSPKTRHLMTYLWALERPHDVLTQQNTDDTSHCPNCGAELDVNAFAECPFCHTQLRQKTSNWVIRDIQAESQVTIK